jgi:hypothetical protein
VQVDQSLTTDIHETILILPGGGFHAQGLLHDVTQPPETCIDRVCSPLRAAAAQQSRTLRLGTGHPDGRGEQCRIAADGMIGPGRHQEPSGEVTAPIWNQGVHRKPPYERAHR